MRIPSGVTDQYIYFVALDATDLKTRETGLASFTVYRSRNGGAAAAFTTPTINEVDATNMPGLYELLLDEDMTIDAGDDSQEMAFHITHAGMAPVTRVIELYRAKITAGNTLGVAADGDLLEANTLTGHTAQTGDSFAYLGTNLGALGANATEAGGTGDHLTAVPWNASWDAEVESEVNDALVALHLDHLLAADYDPAAKPGVATALLNELVESDAGVSRFTANALEQAPTGGSAPTAAQIADAVWTEILADHSGVTGSTAEALAAAGSAGDPWATQLPGAYGAGSAGKIIGDNVNATISSRASQTSLDTVDGIVDTILVDTNELQTDWANGGRLDLLLDATLADTNELQTDWANGGRLDLILDARASQSSVDTIDGIVDAILLDTGTDGVVVAAGSKSGYSLAATGLDLVVPADPSAIPVLGTSSIVAWQGFFAAWTVNEVNTTSTQAKLRNSADTADLATHTISDDGTTFISSEPA